MSDAAAALLQHQDHIVPESATVKILGQLIRAVQAGMTVAVVATCILSLPASARGDGPDFNRDVRPILAEHCFLCHGPDEENRQGGLRLDTSHDARIGGDSEVPAITPGNPQTSELLARIEATDTDLLMPPPEHQKPLSDQQKAILREWIRSGATYDRHWAFEPPRRPELTSSADKSEHPIDRMVQGRLAAMNISPSPPADPDVLCRRLYLDLVGIPPTAEEVDEFVRDYGHDREQAVATLVNKLLASDQFGVRWARHWLDLARYADSHGFQRDDLRDLWPYRDWVVRAMNDDMPFDQFTIEQLAGDLLPDATESQHVATGFNRCTTCNVEAGTEPEENRVNQVFDRVNTVGAVWLGLTLECAQCHDHKFDPITMKDYYRLFAYFNNTEIEAQRANPKTPGSIKFIGPYRELTQSADQSEASVLQKKIDKTKQQIAKRKRDLSAEATAWEERIRQQISSASQVHAMEIIDLVSQQGSGFERMEDGSVLLFDDNTPSTDTYTITATTDQTQLSAIRLDALADPSLPGMGPGRGDATRPNFVLNRIIVQVASADRPEQKHVVVLSNAWASFSQNNYSVTDLLNTPKAVRTRGWAINPEFHKSHWAVFAFEKPPAVSGQAIFTVRLVQDFGGGRTIGRLKLSAITGDPSQAAVPADVAIALNVDAAARTVRQNKALREYHESTDERLQQLNRELRGLQQKLDELPALRSLVMVERPQQRESRMFQRGVYTNPGAEITPGTPSALHSSGSAGRSRLDLARWLVAADNPLTARVTVNRWWAELFGRGLVATPEDFGAKGKQPVYPELLDWLAVELMDNDWSMKHVIRQIVTSRTYQQSSRVSSAMLAVDDDNRWLARGPRFRMDAEMIRDNSLAIAGLLSLEQGGPPIRPPQPAGLWNKVGGEKYDYVVSEGERRHRRGLYVVLKRGSPYPSFVNFDASARMSCVVRRSRSNTPLQALTLLNDPVYVEAAQSFARRIQAAESPNDHARLLWAFRTAVARSPSTEEMQVLQELMTSERESSGEDAAWLAVATALLNLDETITKG